MRQLADLFPTEDHPNVLIGLGEPDDAAAFRIDEKRALIQTTDFFTPIVDDPWHYGAIAAANALSDVYAMGGDVLYCLNIAGFPEDLPAEVITQIMAGGAAKVKEAGAAITGGHTVTNPEPFYGLAVTGIIDSERLLRKGGAQVSDRLFLTKPLGTGVITTAAKLSGEGESPTRRLARVAQGRPAIAEEHLKEAVSSMSRLNRGAALAARAVEARGATDITGFGLLGHSVEMARSVGGGIGFRISAGSVPVLPGALTYAEAGYLTRGSTRNPDHFGEWVEVEDQVPESLAHLLWEAETSGGLLVAVSPERAEEFRTHCLGEHAQCWEIGEVIKGEGVRVVK